MAELTSSQKLVFGADARLHPITGMPLERGSGALDDKSQALLHLNHIARTQGREVADAMLVKIMGQAKADEILQRIKESENGNKDS